MLIVLGLCLAASPRLTLLPAFSRSVDVPTPAPSAHDDPFAVVAALDGDAAAALNTLFGSCFPIEAGGLPLANRADATL